MRKHTHTHTHTRTHTSQTLQRDTKNRKIVLCWLVPPGDGAGKEKWSGKSNAPEAVVGQGASFLRFSGEGLHSSHTDKHKHTYTRAYQPYTLSCRSRLILAFSADTVSLHNARDRRFSATTTSMLVVWLFGTWMEHCLETLLL